MYEQFFHLTEPPFQLTADPRFFFESAGHRRAMNYLTYGLSQGEGYVVITGEVGAGKTTLVGHLLATIDPAKFVTALVVSTQLSGDDMLRMVVAGFGLAHENLPKATLLTRLHNHLKAIVARGSRAVVIVDEAQNVSGEALEELRMLSNLQLGRRPSLQVLLLGQPQFRTMLSNADFAQLRQRVIATFHLGPLSEAETRDYVVHRLTRAGWKNDPAIAEDSYGAIYRATGGVPRLINVLLSRTLLFIYLDEQHAIDAETIEQVADEIRAEFDINPSGSVANIA